MRSPMTMTHQEVREADRVVAELGRGAGRLRLRIGEGLDVLDEGDKLGGVQLAVGADQVYVLAGWSRPEVLVPLDFDTAIRDLHRVYGALFVAASTREAFVRLWSAAAADDVQAALVRTWGEAEGARLLRTWRECHARVGRRFQRMTARYGRSGVPMFLTDDATYGFLRQLWVDGRVIPVRGDVTGERALQSVARAAQGASLPVRLIYLSNVEQYITYNPSFRRNVLALPMDERSVVLRTRSMESLGFAEEGDEYHYNVQPGLNFQAWMRVNRVNEGRFLLRERSSTGRQGLSEITREPPVSTPAPQIAN